MVLSESHDGWKDQSSNDTEMHYCKVSITRSLFNRNSVYSKFHTRLQLCDLVAVVCFGLCFLWESTQMLLFRFLTRQDMCIKLHFSLPVFAQLVATLHL